MSREGLVSLINTVRIQPHSDCNYSYNSPLYTHSHTGEGREDYHSLHTGQGQSHTNINLGLKTLQHSPNVIRGFV